MLILVDTNILLRLVEPSHSQHQLAAESLQSIREFGYRPVIVPQVVYEFWSVATRPQAANGLGLNSSAAQTALDGLLSSLTLLRDERSIFEFWQQIVVEYGVVGKRAHDARLVAAMLGHEISHIVTFNVSDFMRFRADHFG